MRHVELTNFFGAIGANGVESDYVPVGIFVVCLPRCNGRQDFGEMRLAIDNQATL